MTVSIAGFISNFWGPVLMSNATATRTSKRRNVLALGSAALALAVSSSGAMAACTGTGLTALAAPYIAFANGTQVNSLVSAINTANTAFLSQSTAFVSAPGNPAPNQEGGGVWVRGIGGEVTTKSTSTTSNISIFGRTLPGQVTCDSETTLNFAGVQAGADSARLNWNGWNVHVGSSVGYLGAKARDKSSAGPLNPLGGTFEDQLQVPFAGVYVAATRGGFFVDGQIRADYYQNSLNDPLVGGLFNQRLDARGLSFTGNVGYNHQLGNNWFIEPSAGIVISRVRVDPLNVSGAAVNGTGLTLPGTLRINDIKSNLGRLSLRAGTTIDSGNMIWQPFGIASVYHEFAGSVRSSFDDAAFPVVGSNGSIVSTNIGTYGQFGLGIAGQVKGTGLLGYLRGDYRTGDSVHGYSINGGLRYQFTPEMIAGVAPLYTKAAKAPMMMSTAYNWTGFFIGGSFGLLNGKTDWDFLGFGTTANPRFAGAIGGGQIGYDRQIGKWVVGVEGSLNATNAHGGRGCPNGVFFTCQTDINWFGTATAKLGYALTDRSLWYARAGAAFGDLKISTACNTAPTNPLNLAGCGDSAKRSRVGWTIGIGSEFAIARNWTVRTETNYFDMGTDRYNLPASGAINVRQTGFVSTVGVNYRFAPGPVVAKY